MQTIGHSTRYRNAQSELNQKLAKHNQYTINELDEIFFREPEDVTCRNSNRNSFGIGPDGSFPNKGAFLKELNNLLTYTAP